MQPSEARTSHLQEALAFKGSSQDDDLKVLTPHRDGWEQEGAQATLAADCGEAPLVEADRDAR